MFHNLAGFVSHFLMLPSCFMFTGPSWHSLGFSLATILCWGTSDFTGGYASRRANALLLTTITHAAGVVLMVTLATLGHSPFPETRSLLWAAAAGISGGGALAAFYRALSTGKMGLTAPVAAVLGAAVPVIFTVVKEGLPDKAQLLGFLLAGVGIWLIARPEAGMRPEGLGLAVLAGVGFAGFFLCIKQAGDAAALWIAAGSRLASLTLTGLLVVGSWVAQAPERRHSVLYMTKSSAWLGLLAGCLDVSGTALFVRASQTGRLDAAVVLTSLYPAVTVLWAHWILHEHFTRWKMAGMLAALAAVPLIAF
ncbi:MAG: EamA family transporter [Acidobacteria bacterium]|nr:EamA family transporter [Acidobacteriota bacterium]